MQFNILGIILTVIGAFIVLKFYVESDFFNLTCHKSDLDNQHYCVRHRNDIDSAVNLLATINKKNKKLIRHVKNKYPDQDNVKRLVERYNPRKLVEINPLSEHTAYSENKGEKLAFCLTRQKNINSNKIDKNTLTFVAIHELAHIASKTVGHNEEFWTNFKFLLDNAVEINIYDPIDYKNEPVEYCGMEINDNPYYDL